MPEKRLPKEEICDRGDRIFEERIRELVKDRDPMLFVVIDVESGDFEVDSDSHKAVDKLRSRHPDAQIFRRRVGTRFTTRFGFRATMEIRARRGNAQ